MARQWLPAPGGTGWLVSTTIRAPFFLNRSCPLCITALLVVRRHHRHYYCYYYYDDDSRKELAFFQSGVWNNVTAVLQPPRARLLEDGHAVGPACATQERGGSGGGTGQPAKVTGATPASPSASFGKGAGVLRGLSVTHPKAWDGGRVGRDGSKACSWTKLKSRCRCTLQCYAQMLRSCSRSSSLRLEWNAIWKRASSWKLALPLPCSNEALANRLLALQHTCLYTIVLSFALVFADHWSWSKRK